MGRSNSYFCLKLPCVWLLALAIPSTLLLADSARSFTASVGQPYHGRLINGVPFPNQFQGYYLRDGDRAHSTPEVVGALLDALDAVRRQDPNTADVFLGDFSLPSGGAINHHRSHQNGRDVDLGMYSKGNRTLDTFIPMNEENLDVPKTWCLIENLLRSQRVQYIFLDKRIQNLLHDYALSRGADPTYLDHLFGNSRGAIIQHMRNHYDHMHVRFYTPWSTMAAQVGEGDEQKRTIIEMAQQAYLPKKVNYYVKGTEPSLDALAQSFGVNRKDLVRWNQIQGNDAPRPGSCVVFYKRGFELEPVHLAQSLQPDTIPETPVVQLASLRNLKTATDAPLYVRDSASRERRQEHSTITTRTVRKGETLQKLAKSNGMDIKTLCDLNGLKKNASLKPGQKIKIASSKPQLVIVSKSHSDPPGPLNAKMVQANSRNGSPQAVQQIRLAQADRPQKAKQVVSDAVSPSVSSDPTKPSTKVTGASKNAAKNKVQSSAKTAQKNTPKVSAKPSSATKRASAASSPAVSTASKPKASAGAEKKASAPKKPSPAESTAKKKAEAPTNASKTAKHGNKKHVN